jgi:hypothetical protein
MAKADTQKAKGDIWWQSARIFGQEGSPTTWRPARMNPRVSNPQSEIGNRQLLDLPRVCVSNPKIDTQN